MAFIRGTTDKSLGVIETKILKLSEKHPKIADRVNHINHLGTLGTGNHFIEICLDEEQFVWFMLHSVREVLGIE